MLRCAAIRVRCALSSRCLGAVNDKSVVMAVSDTLTARLSSLETERSFYELLPELIQEHGQEEGSEVLEEVGANGEVVAEETEEEAVARES